MDTADINHPPRTPEEESLEMKDASVLVLALTACLSLCSGAPAMSKDDQKKAEVHSYG